MHDSQLHPQLQPQLLPRLQNCKNIITRQQCIRATVQACRATSQPCSQPNQQMHTPNAAQELTLRTSVSSCCLLASSAWASALAFAMLALLRAAYPDDKVSLATAWLTRLPALSPSSCRHHHVQRHANRMMHTSHAAQAFAWHRHGGLTMSTLELNLEARCMRTRHRQLHERGPARPHSPRIPRTNHTQTCKPTLDSAAFCCASASSAAVRSIVSTTLVAGWAAAAPNKPCLSCSTNARYAPSSRGSCSTYQQYMRAVHTSSTCEQHSAGSTDTGAVHHLQAAPMYSIILCRVNVGAG